VNVKTRKSARNRADYREADRLLMHTARRGGPWVAALVVAALATAGGALALPAVLGRAVDALVHGGAPGRWLTWCAALVALLVAAEVLDSLASGTAIARSTAWLRHGFWRHVLSVRGAATGGLAPGEVAGRLVGNAAEAAKVAPDAVRAVANAIPPLGATVALALIDPWLCLTFLLGMPAFAAMVNAFARDASDVAGRYFRVQGAIAARLVDALAGARTIAAAGTLDREVQRVLGPLPELRRHGLGVWHAQMRISAQDVLLVSLLELAVLAVAGAELSAGRITPGQLLAASEYVVLATGLGSSVGGVARVARSRAAAARVVEVLAEPVLEYGTARLPAGPGRLEFRGVTVQAGGERVLGDVQLVVPGGASVAVVGRTGAGKSLLAALAGRLADPDEGEVLLDGVPLPRLARDELRRAVGYGFERPALIGDALADAIAFGAYEPPPERVIEAAREARADEFIRRLPEGYRTPLPDAPMSGGERQRVGLARTFAHAGRVLILDDVAASLDTVTEHHIARVLTTALSGRTRLVVAHRASTAAGADLVVWLDGGTVRAAAPHATLWHEPEYRRLFAPDGEPERPAVVREGWWTAPAPTARRRLGTWCDIPGGVA
jgi:ATP-binding cassette subfamily B protein